MKKLLGLAAFVAVAALPTASLAQTYAYVNTSGEVKSMEAASASAALSTAPNIGMHSGVIMLDSSTDGIVGDSVSGS